jgi:hypothetical protein
MVKNYFFFFLFLQIIQFNVIAQNILITEVSGNDQGYGPNEPSIIMDPKDTDILVAGTILNDFHRSTDGGQTWTRGQLNSSYGVWGDPVIDVDNQGNFYYFHLSNTPNDGWLDRIVCQKSVDKGSTWSDGSYVGLNGKDHDKQWSVIDRRNNNIYLTWTQFDEYPRSGNPPDPDCISVILFSKSLDGGETWSEPKRINKFSGECRDDDNSVGGAVPAVGPNGEIYVSWTGPKGILFNRSFDEGETWLDEEIQIDSMPGGWDIDIPGISRCNGFPVTKCDLSGGPNHGTIYVNWSDQRNGVDNTDIWLSKSMNGGDTWSLPSKVNNDNSNHHQFFTWMDIDQMNGNLHFIFYDRRNYLGDQTDVFLAFSNDGGDSFSNKKISEEPFLPNRDIFFGDYNNITVHNNIVRPIWTRLHEGKISVWTDVTPFDETLSDSNSIEEQNFETKIYPNPMVDENTYVSFKLRGPSFVSIELIDGQGKLMHTIFDSVEMGYGVYNVPVDLTELSLEPGLYYTRLSINGKSKILKTLVIR